MANTKEIKCLKKIEVYIEKSKILNTINFCSGTEADLCWWMTLDDNVLARDEDNFSKDDGNYTTSESIQ